MRMWYPALAPTRSYATCADFRASCARSGAGHALAIARPSTLRARVCVVLGPGSAASCGNARNNGASLSGASDHWLFLCDLIVRSEMFAPESLRRKRHRRADFGRDRPREPHGILHFLLPEKSVRFPHHENGPFARLLGPGRYELGKTFFDKVDRTVTLVDVRKRSLTIKLELQREQLRSAAESERERARLKLETEVQGAKALGEPSAHEAAGVRRARRDGSARRGGPWTCPLRAM